MLKKFHVALQESRQLWELTDLLPRTLSSTTTSTIVLVSLVLDPHLAEQVRTLEVGTWMGFGSEIRTGVAERLKLAVEDASRP